MRRWLGRAGRKAPPGWDKNLWATRRRLVSELAPGRSFIDVGGMWAVHGLVGFLAEEAGATEVTVFDAMDPSDEFRSELERRRSSVRFVQGDLHDPQSIEALGAFDVVWCGGVIYHSPNPYLLLEHLRRITRNQLVLGTHVIPEVPGIEQACIFYPGMSAGSRDAFARAHGDEAPLLTGATTPFDPTPTMGYVNFWWGITRSALHAMLDVARFEIVREHDPSPFFTDVLARPIDRPSVIPEPGFARERGRDRAAGSR
jgi:SAM-dependent methyltransferase